LHSILHSEIRRSRSLCALSALYPVQGGNCVLNKQVIRVVSGFPTEFCTAVLKSISRGVVGGGETPPG
jgi:hypothetical protein